MKLKGFSKVAQNHVKTDGTTKKEVNIYPTSTKPNQIDFSSPGIDDNFILSSTTVSVTPD